MDIKQLYSDNLRILPNEYGDVSVMVCIFLIRTKGKNNWALRIVFLFFFSFFFFFFFFLRLCHILVSVSVLSNAGCQCYVTSSN